MYFVCIVTLAYDGKFHYRVCKSNIFHRNLLRISDSGRKREVRDIGEVQGG